AALCLPVLVAARSGRRGELLSFPTRRSSDLLHPLLAEVRPRHKVFDIACATTQRDAVLLVWPFLAKQPVPPILVGVINPTSFALDRKSTRLNSSHVKISYAVFCLKKKKLKKK